MHEALGTAAGGGTLRLAPGYSTSLEDIDITIETLQNVATGVGTPGALRAAP
jgi:hypothetical protein